jgi:hypothetical protein
MLIGNTEVSHRIDRSRSLFSFQGTLHFIQLTASRGDKYDLNLVIFISQPFISSKTTDFLDR